MNVYINEVNGLADALVALIMTKRNWTRENEKRIRALVQTATDNYPNHILELNALEENDKLYMEKMINAFVKVAPVHITVGKMIDLSVTVDGLHRAGQDDWDSHAKRFDNRIIRVSTRASADVFGEGEVSDFYKGKIIPTAVALKETGVNVPEELEINGEKYVKTVNGYILDKYKDNQDVKRGLYMLSIPSTFIFKCNLTDFAHVYKQRRNEGHANPEVKECCEAIVDQLTRILPFVTREWLASFHN